MKIANWILAAACLALCGCGANYQWKSSVPKNMRTIFVPTFRNESEVNEFGAIATRQILREIQREGTFKIAEEGNAALEVQGVVKSYSGKNRGYSRTTEMQNNAYKCTATVVISVIDKRRHRVLINNKTYTATDFATIGQDATTGYRNASGRVADELSRQVVDDLLKMDFTKGVEK